MVETTLPNEDVVFVFGPFTLDPRTRRLLRGGTTVPLTTKAFDTLEALVQSAGRTLTKDALLKQIWRDTFVQEDTLAQNISTIRRVLGDACAHVESAPRT
jgi:DNA-binding winged helix-turn-helix (wHTH) protein